MLFQKADIQSIYLPGNHFPAEGPKIFGEGIIIK